MEPISDNELSMLATGNCSPPGELIQAIARELKRYRAAGPRQDAQIRDGQVWQCPRGEVLFLERTETRYSYSIEGRVLHGEMPPEQLQRFLLASNYRLVAGPGAKP